MLIADILKLPGKVYHQLSFSLLRKIAGHHECPDEVEGVTWRSFARVPGDAMGKGGREVGAVYLGDKPAALCFCRGKHGDEWEVHVIDKPTYAALYLKLLEYSDEFEAAGSDICEHLSWRDLDLLIQVGVADSRPPPSRAESYNHLHQLLMLRAAAAGIEADVISSQEAGFFARPSAFAREVCAGLVNASLEPFEASFFTDAVRITLVLPED